MKYVNQLNIVLVTFGALVVGYTFSETFWKVATSSDEPALVELPAPAVPRPAPAAALPLRQEPQQTVPPFEMTRPPVEAAIPEPAPLPVETLGQNPPEVTPPPPAAAPRPQPAATGPKQIRIEGKPEDNPSAASASRGRSGSASSRNRLSNRSQGGIFGDANSQIGITGTNPTAAPDAQKRPGSQDPVPPPRRSSMPEQQPPGY